MTIRLIAAATAMAALAACESTQDAATQTGFRAPNASGFITSGVATTPGRGAARKVEDAQGDGYAYSVGNSSREGDGFVGFASLLPRTSVRPQPNRGTATYDASYNVLMITGIDLNGQLLSGQIRGDSGNITLRADFDANTLNGSDGDLRVRGELVDGQRSFGGRVNYRGVQGALRGRAGSDEVVGAFHGNDENLIYSGGFLGDAR